MLIGWELNEQHSGSALRAEATEFRRGLLIGAIRAAFVGLGLVALLASAWIRYLPEEPAPRWTRFLPPTLIGFLFWGWAWLISRRKTSRKRPWRCEVSDDNVVLPGLTLKWSETSAYVLDPADEIPGLQIAWLWHRSKGPVALALPEGEIRSGVLQWLQARLPRLPSAGSRSTAAPPIGISEAGANLLYLVSVGGAIGLVLLTWQSWYPHRPPWVVALLFLVCGPATIGLLLLTREARLRIPFLWRISYLFNLIGALVGLVFLTILYVHRFFYK
jgi:hypothetical protein